MNRDPLGLGRMLYGFRPQPVAVGTLLAAGAQFMTLIPDGHGGCGISVFCKNPLHPGPCKGWKRSLGKNAPGALTAIEKAHKEKVAAKRIARNEAKSAASKKLTNRQLESPLHAKKATIKAANTILGDDDVKASKKADRVILNKAEIKKYSKIKAAQMNAMRTKHGLTEDTGLEDRLAAALAEDNKTGKDTKYRETIAVSGDSLGAQLAQKHCAKGDGDCDGKPYEWLRDETSGYAEQALLTGDDSDLDTFLKDYDAGKAKPPAPPKPKAPGPLKNKTAINDADDPEKVLETLKGLDKANVQALNDSEKQALQDKLQAVADGSLGSPSEAQKAAAKKALSVHFGVKLPAKTAKQAEAEANIAKAKAAGDLPADYDIAKDLELLKKQHAKGLMTDAEYEFEKANITAGKPTPSGVPIIPPVPIGEPLDLTPSPNLDNIDKKNQLELWGQLLHGIDGQPGASSKSSPEQIYAAAAAVVAKNKGKKSKFGPNLSVADVLAIADYMDAQLHSISAPNQHKWKKKMAGFIPPAPEPPAPKKAKTGSAPLEGTALQAEKGKNFGMGLMAMAKGNKTLGTKAAQKSFADKIQAELDGETKDVGGKTMIEHGADTIASVLIVQSQAGTMMQPTLNLGKNEVAKLKELLKPEIMDGLQGGDAPKPLTEAFKKAIKGKHEKDWNAVKEAKTEIDDQIKSAAAKKIGVDPNASKYVVSAHILFDPNKNLSDGHVKAREQTLENLTKEEFDALPDAHKATIATWLEGYAQAKEEAGAISWMDDAIGWQEKFGLPAHKPAGAPEPEPTPEPDVLQDLMDAIPTATTPAPAAPAAPSAPTGLSKDAKKAFDFATGAKAGTLSKKFEAYQVLEGEEFAAMSPEVQGLIMADLQAAKAKFISGQKIAAVTETINYLSPFAGGGAGAGGSLGAPNPSTKSDADKVHDGADWASTFVPLLDKPGGTKAGPKDEIYAASLALLQSASDSGSKQKIAESMSGIWATAALEKLNAMHTDPFGNAFLLPDDIESMAPALAADIAKKFAGESGPTPVLDAWKKAISLGIVDDAAAFMDAASPGGAGAAGDFNKPASLAEIIQKQQVADLLWMEAGGPYSADKPPNAPSFADLYEPVKTALDTGTFPAFVDAQSTAMTSGVIKSVKKKAGVNMLPTDLDDLDKIIAAMKGEFAQALNSGSGVVPAGGTVEKVHEAAAEVVEAGAQLAAKNGWDANSPALVNFKRVLMTARLDEIAANLSPSTGVTAPAATPTAAPTPSVPSVPSVPSAPTPAKKTNTAVGTGADISGIPVSKQKELWDDLKALPSGKYLSDPKDDVYKNLLALAAAHGTADQPLSVLQVLKSLDAAGSKANGWTNINKWENEFVDWLKTPAGTAFATANPTADPKLVKKITGEFGEYEGITTDLVALSKKVPLLNGPGGFDPDKPSSDFKVMTPTAAATMRAKMLASNGGQYTASEQAGIWVYTSNQYGAMNSWLRGETNTLSEARKKAIQQTQAAMRPVTEDLIVHRGTGFDALPEGFQSHAGAKALIGKTVMDEAFMSTSVGGGAAFGGAMLLELEVPKGTQAAYVDGKNKDGQKISSNPGEREMLLAAGQSYQIISVTKNGYQTVVRARIVTGNAPGAA